MCITRKLIHISIKGDETMEKKERYENPEMEVVMLEKEDVILTSGCPLHDPNETDKM